jgi:hypothetical protein
MAKCLGRPRRNPTIPSLKNVFTALRRVSDAGWLLESLAIDSRIYSEPTGP